ALIEKFVGALKLVVSFLGRDDHSGLTLGFWIAQTILLIMDCAIHFYFWAFPAGGLSCCASSQASCLAPSGVNP
ncbi:hypothetical protein DVF44_24710, partial [Salmonella enterica subsp. enterica serovar Schwarzengrund]|nr:hypothetical protein [Salmonella enterica subsp. enterica serovar Schwarzengrund]